MRASSDPKHFIPNIYVEINENHLNKKISAMECYEFERRPFTSPISRSFEDYRAKEWSYRGGKFC